MRMSLLPPSEGKVTRISRIAPALLQNKCTSILPCAPPATPARLLAPLLARQDAQDAAHERRVTRKAANILVVTRLRWCLEEDAVRRPGLQHRGVHQDVVGGRDVAAFRCLDAELERRLADRVAASRAASRHSGAACEPAKSFFPPPSGRAKVSPTESHVD